MTGPHLCETESWPGHGARPAGRRPTPYLLTLLAVVYNCTVADLLDLADYEHMPPADLLILGKAAGPNEDLGQHPQRLAPIRPALVTTVTAGPRRIAPVVPLPAQAGVRATEDARELVERAVAPKLGPLAGAMLSAPQGGEVTRESLADDAVNIWRLRQAAQYRTLASMLPVALANARAGEAGLTGDPQLASALTHLYNVASSLARAFGSLELAGIAADRAVHIASSIGDPLLSGAAAYRLANVLLAGGQLKTAQVLAIGAADRLRPALNASRSHTAMWGALLATGALAAARAHAAAEARELLGASRVAADLLATEQADLFSIFGPANWLIHAVNVAADLGDGADAVNRAEQIPAERLPPSLAERRTFLLLGQARGHALCGDTASAALALLDADEAAPEEVRLNPEARSLVARLLAASCRRDDRLQELAARMSGPSERASW